MMDEKKRVHVSKYVIVQVSARRYQVGIEKDKLGLNLDKANENFLYARRIETVTRPMAYNEAKKYILFHEVSKIVR